MPNIFSYENMLMKSLERQSSVQVQVQALNNMRGVLYQQHHHRNASRKKILVRFGTKILNARCIETQQYNTQYQNQNSYYTRSELGSLMFFVISQTCIFLKLQVAKLEKNTGFSNVNINEQEIPHYFSSLKSPVSACGKPPIVIVPEVFF